MGKEAKKLFKDANKFLDLAVKEKLAIEIKQIVESNRASFAFPSQSIYVEKK